MGALALLNLGAAMVRLYPPGQAAAAASAALSGTDDAALQQVGRGLLLPACPLEALACAQLPGAARRAVPCPLPRALPLL